MGTCGVKCPGACWSGPANAVIWCVGNGSSTGDQCPCGSGYGL